MRTAISIGCQQGGPGPCLISTLKIALYRLLAKHVTSTHCDAIDEYSLVLRVDGSLDQFGEEGLARLRFAKTRRYITLDIQVPESVWKPMNEAQTRLYLAKQIKVAIRACVDRLVSAKHAVNEPLLMAQFDAALNEFLVEQNAG